jgi:hypothetical protein
MDKCDDPSQKVSLGHACGGVVAASVLVLIVGCGLLPSQPSVEFSFDNRSGSVLCWDPSVEDAATARCLAEVEPQAVTKWSPGCGYGNRPQEAPITVVLTVKESGQRIYNRTASCEAWLDTDRKFIIEQKGGDFIVTGPE